MADFIEKLMARSEAQDAILQAIAGQVALLFEDWRDALDTMRVVAQVGIREELCWNLGDAVIRRRSALACWRPRRRFGM
jgi:hypothetical protein